MKVSHMLDTAQADTGWKMGALAGLALIPRTARGPKPHNSTRAGLTGTPGYNTPH